MKITNVIIEAISGVKRIITHLDSSIDNIETTMIMDNASTQFFNSIFHLYFEGKENSIDIDEITFKLNQCFSELDEKQRVVFKLGEIQSYVKLQNKYYEVMKKKEFTKNILKNEEYKTVLIYLGRVKKEEKSKLYAYLKQNLNINEQGIDFLLLHLQQSMILDAFNIHRKEYYCLTKDGYSIFKILEKDSYIPISGSSKYLINYERNNMFDKSMGRCIGLTFQPIEEKKQKEDLLFSLKFNNKEKDDNEFKRKYREYRI